MQHNFDISIAQKYGVNVAIFLNSLAFWIQRNIANEKNFKDGRYWSYNTQKAWLVLFPYWTRQNLRTVINSAIEQGLIVTGNYNDNKYLQTMWYALTDLGLSLFPSLENIHKPPVDNSENRGWNQPMGGIEPTTSLVETNQCIKDTDTEPDILTNKSKRVQKKRKPISDNFYPNHENQKLADRKAKELGTTGAYLIKKFIEVHKKYETNDTDFDKVFVRFLERQRPFKRQGTSNHDQKQPNGLSTLENRPESSNTGSNYRRGAMRKAEAYFLSGKETA